MVLKKQEKLHNSQRDKNYRHYCLFFYYQREKYKIKLTKLFACIKIKINSLKGDMTMPELNELMYKRCKSLLLEQENFIDYYFMLMEKRAELIKTQKKLIDEGYKLWQKRLKVLGQKNVAKTDAEKDALGNEIKSLQDDYAEVANKKKGVEEELKSCNLCITKVLEDRDKIKEKVADLISEFDAIKENAEEIAPAKEKATKDEKTK